MGNHASLTHTLGFGIVIALAAIFLFNPLSAHATSSSDSRARLSEQAPQQVRDTITSRLCERQERLGSRLRTPLVDPQMCSAAPPLVPMLDLVAAPLSIIAGSSTELSWNSSNVTTCTASNGWSGSKALNGTQSVSPLVTTTYTLECMGAGGAVSDSVTVTVLAAPLTPTLTLSANPLAIAVGATSSLSWTSTNVTSCTASEGWSGARALSGTVEVMPSATTTYQLDCTGAGGTVSKTVTVTVSLQSPQPTVTLVAVPSQVTPSVSGATTTLTWTSTNTTLCVASGGTWTGAKAVNGSQVVTPTATTTYMLECSGPGGVASASVTVNFSTALVPVVTLSASPIFVTPGTGSATTTLTWTSTNATTCTAFGGWTGSKALNGSEIVSPTATTTYQLDCSGFGGVGSDDAVVNFVPTPALGTITQIVVGDSRFDTLEAAVIAAELADDLASDGPFTVFAPTDDAFAALPEGVLASLLAAPTTTLKDVLLYHVASGNLDSTEVAALDTIASLLAGKLLDVSVSGAGVMINNALITIADIPASNGVIHVINAVLIPPATPTLTLIATPGSVTPGTGSASSTLSWTSTGAQSCVASQGWTGARAVNGSEIVTPVATTTYELNCSGLGGNVQASVQVNFIPEVMPPVLIGHMVISEVLYDAASTTLGSENFNEWVELYNGTNAPINLQGWFVGDASSTDMIVDSVVVQPGGYAIIAASTTPVGIPLGVPVVVLLSSIGNNGFANGGDGAVLRNAADVLVDSVGYGTNVTLTPTVSIPGSHDGYSIARVQLTSDTDTAGDWANSAVPTPGN